MVESIDQQCGRWWRGWVHDPTLMGDTVGVPILVWSDDDAASDPMLTGAKFAALASMARWPSIDRPTLVGGAALTTDAWRRVVDHNDLWEQVDAAVAGDEASAEQLRSRFGQADLPDDVADALTSSFEHVCAECEDDVAVAVRSSAVAEDLAGRTFAGQYLTRLSVRDGASALTAYRDCLASAWSAGTRGYRRRTSRPDVAIDCAGGDAGGVAGGGSSAGGALAEHAAMAVILQPMVHSGDGWAGAALSDGSGGVVVEAVRGLGDRLMSGRADPLRWSVVSGERPDGALASVVVDWVRRAERRVGHAVEVEFAVRADGSVPVILQSRPYRPATPPSTLADRWHRPTGDVNGLAVGQGVVRGPVCRLDSPEETEALEPGAVLVTSATDPGWLPLLAQVGAVVTDHGGLTSHAAIVCRELGLLAVVGCGDATRRLVHGETIEVRCDGPMGSITRVGAGRDR